MLRNLKEIHKTQEDWLRLIAVQDRLIVLQPDAWPEYRDRGLALAVQGEVARAVTDLETYLAHAEDALDIDAIAERLAGEVILRGVEILKTIVSTSTQVDTCTLQIQNSNAAGGSPSWTLQR